MQIYKEMEYSAPVTQTVEAVKGLLTWRGRGADPLPEFVELEARDERVVLVLSNKKDAYYTTTARACSCPAHTYRAGPCKHVRKHFPEASQKNISSSGLGSIIPKMPFKPFLEVI